MFQIIKLRFSLPRAILVTIYMMLCPYCLITLLVSNIRGVIAKRLTESKQTVPHQYSSAKINVANAAAMRKDLAENGFKISMNDMVIKVSP